MRVVGRAIMMGMVIVMSKVIELISMVLYAAIYWPVYAISCLRSVAHSVWHPDHNQESFGNGHPYLTFGCQTCDKVFWVQPRLIRGYQEWEKRRSNLREELQKNKRR